MGAAILLLVAGVIWADHGVWAYAAACWVLAVAWVLAGREGNR